MKSTVVIGTAFVDIKGFANSGYNPKGRNLGEIQFVHGGVGRNVVENFANVNMPVQFAGMLDDSPTGQDVEKHLKTIGVDLQFAAKTPKNGIGMWMVILGENGDLEGSISKMPDLTYLEEYLKTKGDKIIKEAEAVVLEFDLSENIAELIINLAEKYQKDVYAIVGNMSVVLARKDLIKKTKCFICNEIEAEKFFNVDFSKPSIKELLITLSKAANDAGLSSVVVTLGERGSIFFEEENKCAEFCPIFPTEVVDTTGAGDAFFSGTVMGLIRGVSMQKATKYGSKLASLTISRKENSCPVDKSFFDK